MSDKYTLVHEGLDQWINSPNNGGECCQTWADTVDELNRLLDRIKRLEAVVSDPHALWTNWLRGAVKMPEGIGDVRQYQERIKLMEEALSVVVVSCDHLNHSKKHRHQLGEPCPVVELFRFYRRRSDCALEQRDSRESWHDRQ